MKRVLAIIGCGLGLVLPASAFASAVRSRLCKVGRASQPREAW